VFGGTMCHRRRAVTSHQSEIRLPMPSATISCGAGGPGADRVRRGRRFGWIFCPYRARILPTGDCIGLRAGDRGEDGANERGVIHGLRLGLADEAGPQPGDLVGGEAGLVEVDVGAPIRIGCGG
jgi:hypothetical protein